MRLYTDYPFVPLGDDPGKEAPIRECRIISYDGNKYCTISVCGHVEEIKAGYIYRKPGRSGEVPMVPKLYLKWKGLFT